MSIQYVNMHYSEDVWITDKFVSQPAKVNRQKLELKTFLAGNSSGMALRKTDESISSLF